MHVRIARTESENYHHGELAEASLRITLEMLATEGAAPSIRSVAKRAGVSATALYHHYHGRDGLLAAAGSVGFERVVRLLPDLDAGLAPAEAFGELVERYVDFAVDNQPLWNVMFDRALKDRDVKLNGAAEIAYARLRSWLVSNFRLPDDPSRELRLLCIWSVMQGMTSLRLARLAGRARVEGEAACRFARNLPAAI